MYTYVETILEIIRMTVYFLFYYIVLQCSVTYGVAVDCQYWLRTPSVTDPLGTGGQWKLFITYIVKFLGYPGKKIRGWIISFADSSEIQKIEEGWNDICHELCDGELPSKPKYPDFEKGVVLQNCTRPRTRGIMRYSAVRYTVQLILFIIAMYP